MDTIFFDAVIHLVMGNIMHAFVFGKREQENGARGKAKSSPITIYHRSFLHLDDGSTSFSSIYLYFATLSHCLVSFNILDKSTKDLCPFSPLRPKTGHLYESLHRADVRFLLLHRRCWDQSGIQEVDIYTSFKSSMI